MIPIKLLEIVKGRFTPLLVQEEPVLHNLLVKALTTYQDKAGYVKRVRLTKANGTDIPFPDDYLELIHISDARGSHVDTEVYDDLIEIHPGFRNSYPFTMSYLVNLRDMNIEKDKLPASIVGYLDDYLYHLINMQNSSRLRRVSIAGKLDASDIPDEQTLYQRKIELETAMSQNRAIITGATLL